MIISHKHKFIFIKTNKTAGTSIEIALSKFCGDEDVITPITPEDEVMRANLGYRGPQNYLASLSDYGVRDYWRWMVRGRKKLRYYNHISCREVKAHLGDAIWNSYFKFCFERNPFDRFISLYYWKNKKEPRPSISEFLDSGAPNILRERGYQLYTIDGTVAVDRVCLFEKMQEELEKLAVQLGLPEKLEPPRAKGSYRKDRRSPREILNDQEKEKLTRIFSKEIFLFGYEMSSPPRMEETQDLTRKNS